MSMTLRRSLDAIKMAWSNRFEPESMRPLARAYWALTLALALAITAAAFVNGGVLLARVLRQIGDAPGAKQIGKPQQWFDRAQLERIIGNLSARQAAFGPQVKARETPPDPSL